MKKSNYFLIITTHSLACFVPLTIAILNELQITSATLVETFIPAILFEIVAIFFTLLSIYEKINTCEKSEEAKQPNKNAEAIDERKHLKDRLNALEVVKNLTKRELKKKADEAWGWDIDRDVYDACIISSYLLSSRKDEVE